MALQLPPELQSAIDLLIRLELKFLKNPHVLPDEIDLEKASSARDVIRNEVLPLIRDLIAAKMITLDVENRNYLKKKFRSAQFEVSDIYENASIVLQSGNVSGFIPAIDSNGNPNLPKSTTYAVFSREYHRMCQGHKGPFVQWEKDNRVDIETRYREFQKKFEA